jgi:hypothetical protein
MLLRPFTDGSLSVANRALSMSRSCALTDSLA